MARAIYGPNVTAATSSQEGVAELATDAETETGTDAARVMTPANASATYPRKSLLTTKGDIAVATGTSVWARLAAGANGRVLTADSTQSTGLKWATPRAHSSTIGPTGNLGETFARGPAGVGNVNGPATGQLYLVAIPLTEGDVITNITFYSRSTAAVTPTNWWFGLFDFGRNSLKYTADQLTAAWPATTKKTLALTSTHTVTYSGLHYLGMVMAAATVISFAGATSTSNLFVNEAPISAGVVGTGTGSTGITTPASFGAVGTATGALTASATGQPYGFVT